MRPWEQEPLAAGARSRPPTFPPAPADCGEGGGDFAVPDPNLLTHLEGALAAAFEMAYSLEGPSSASRERALRGATSRLRSYLRELRLEMLLLPGPARCADLKTVLLEMAERPVATPELEQRWRDACRRRTAHWSVDALSRLDALEMPPFALGRYALGRAWMPAPLFCSTLAGRLVRLAISSLTSTESFQTSAMEPLFALYLAALDVTHPARRLRTPTRRLGGRRRGISAP